MSNQITLALSGGGMRGCAHIGVYKKLEELQLKIKAVSGTSVGAMIGAFIADGFHAPEIEELFIRAKFSFDINYFGFKKGLLRSNRIETMLKKNLRSKTFEQLQMPFYACVTNYKSGKAEYLYEGNLVNSILASSAIPMLYEPVNLNGTLYIDGGMSRNLPSEILITHKLPIVGVHANPLHTELKHISFKQKLDHNVHLGLLEKIENAIKICSVFIEPEKLLNYSVFETKHIKNMIAIGYEKAGEHDILKTLLSGL